MRITIESDERTTTAHEPQAAATGAPLEAAVDGGPSRAAGAADGVDATAEIETIDAGPVPAELVEAIAAAEVGTRAAAGTSDALDAGPGPAE
jgi:hypothetical protein